MSDDRQIHDEPVSRIVDVKTGELVIVYRDVDGTVIGWKRRKMEEKGKL